MDEDLALLDLPDRKAIKEWLKAVRRQRGEAKYLTCRFMLDTGVRLHEAVALLESQWPTRDMIERCRKRNRTHTFLRLLVTKSGNNRTIRVSITLADDIRRWIDGEREGLVRSGGAKTSRLFLSDRPGHEGKPIQSHTVYDCFHEVEPRPGGWHPHMARHAYACHRMRDLIAAELRADPLGKGPAWVESRGRFALDLIRRQLGHVSEETTRVYLAYLRNTVGMVEENDHWQDTVAGKGRAR